MPLIIIPLILAVVVGLSSGFISVDLLGSRNQEEQTLAEQIPATENLVIELTPSPIPTPKPQVAYKQPESTPKPTTDLDPIVNCHGAKGGQCENQTIKLRRSECNGSSSFVCCQVDNGWKLMSRSECAKAQNNEATNRGTEQKAKLEAELSRQEALSAIRKAERERKGNDLLEKSRKDFEDFRKQSSSDTDQFIQKSRDDFKRVTDDTDKSIAETKARIKQSEERQKKEFYDMCAGNVFTKYDRYPGRLRIERNNSLVKQYEDELAQCAFLYK